MTGEHRVHSDVRWLKMTRILGSRIVQKLSAVVRVTNYSLVISVISTNVLDLRCRRRLKQQKAGP